MGTSGTPPNSVIFISCFPECPGQVEYHPSRNIFICTGKYTVMYTAVQLKFEL
jgi:hypothetical protein